jgi:hypothetical protein
MKRRRAAKLRCWIFGCRKTLWRRAAVRRLGVLVNAGAGCKKFASRSDGDHEKRRDAARLLGGLAVF